MPPSAKIVTVGKMGSSFGVKGWIKIQSLTSPLEKILDYQPWFLEMPDGQWKSLDVDGVESHHKGIIAKFAGIESPEAARQLTGRAIGVDRHVLPAAAPGEYYWMDLLGLDVLTSQGEVIGIVDSLIETGANDVLVCKGEKEHLIPFVKDVYIVSVNLDKGQIIVNWESHY